MKSILKKRQQNIIKPDHRIVLKFRDDFHIPYGDVMEINDFLLEKEIISWKKLVHKFPGIRINKLFTSLSPGLIKEMVQKAKNRDSSYKPPNFLTYFAIDFSN